MPELPIPKPRKHPAKIVAPAAARDAAPREEARPAVPYAELHALTNFSFLRGASHPDQMVAQARELGYDALAVTDEHSLAGIVRAHVTAKDAGLPLIVGAEVPLHDAATVVLLAQDRAGYGRLSRLLTLGRRRAEKGACELRRDDVAAAGEGLLALAVADEEALRPDAGADALERAAERLAWVRESFGARAWLEAALHDGPDDAARMRRLDRLSDATGLPLVAAGGVEAHDATARPIRDTLLAVHHGCTVAELGHRVPAHGIRVLRDRATLERLHRERPQLLHRTLDIAARCRFSLDELRYEYPLEGGAAELRRLVEEGAAARWPAGVAPKVRALLEQELALISELQYEPYFLTVHELVTFARKRGILCQGRGSAANSAVCFALGITSVDPARFDVLFERFVSRDRNEPPDIDVDFEHERREEVIQHVYERYGRERAALAATVISYRGRSAVRDVGKALGLTLDQVDRLAGTIEWWDGAEWPAQRLRDAGFDPEDAVLRRVIAVARAIQGFPRHLSQHVGGMVITAGRLDEIVPIENAAMADRTVIEWDKDDLDAVGMLKVDCLALGMLTAIRRAFTYVEEARGRELTLATVPADDPSVYAMIQRADTVGVFQIESRAQMAMLPRLKPRCFYDLVIEVAIVRPGPIQGGMVHPYLRRREGLEPVEYPSEEVRLVLEKTLGVPIFQEQAMRLAVVAAGFTPGEADQLRRAMGAWRRPGLIQDFAERLVKGMLARGYSQEFADALFKQIQGFGEYGFPESHAASFALLTWVSCWLKRHEPACFTAALLNSQPMGFYAPAQLIRDARSHGVLVRPADVAHSAWDCTLEDATAERGGAAGEDPATWGVGGPALRLGFRVIKGLAESAGLRLVAARSARAFASVEDCKQRARLDARESKLLAAAGAFGALAPHRRAAAWEAATPRDDSALFAAQTAPPGEVPAPAPMSRGNPALAAPDWADTIAADYRSTGFSLAGHPCAVLRPELERRGIRRAEDLAKVSHGRFATVAGVVVNRQRPATANGILFMTLEDETGYVNLLVHLETQERFRREVLGSRLLAVRGKVERAYDVVHLMAAHFEDLTPLIGTVPTASRDFH